MGIAGLLPLLKPVSESRTISEYGGQTIAIDGYSWLHRGMYGSALKYCLDGFSRKHIDYCIGKIQMLVSCNIKPVVVFDGGHLPIKSGKEAERSNTRRKAKSELLKALKQKDLSSAWNAANKCVEITPRMAHELIVSLIEHKIDYIVAPYEADAQMAYLNLNGFVDAVMTEDSDLILFGCTRVLYKFQSDGRIEEINCKKIFESKSLNLYGLCLDRLRRMCILAGCDYLSSIPRMGLKTAYKYVKTYGSIKNVIRAILASGNFVVPTSYEQKYRLAELTFLHQQIFDPVTGEMTFLTPIKNTSDINPFNLEDLDFLGHHLPPVVVRGIATGQLCPITLMPFDKSQTTDYPGWRDYSRNWNTLNDTSIEHKHE